MNEYIPPIINHDHKELYKILKSSIEEVAENRGEWEALSTMEIMKEMATENALLAGLAVENYDLAIALLGHLKDYIKEEVKADLLAESAVHGASLPS